MVDLSARLALKERLPRTWPAFFGRHGSFTAAQLAAIPALLDGANVLLDAPTASGKTAAVLAPLIERHCPPVPTTAAERPAIRILYLTPTRALVNDLHERLAVPLHDLGLKLGAKTRDSTFRPDRPPHVLLTTPELTDALLAARAHLFANLRAIVIDELHLFDRSPRGDQLRVLLNRIRRIRAYAAQHEDAPDAALQYAALSATLDAPDATVARYFAPAQVIQVAGRRALSAEQLTLTPDSGDEFLAFLATFRARGWRKALVFCNSRAEVEAYATTTRAASPFGHSVFVHYSNLEPQRRREVEQQFATHEVAICFASSTLELGIDIGSIDVVILIGPPGSPASFAQRVGRGGRRRGTTPVVCCGRTPLERLLFNALIAQGRDWRLEIRNEQDLLSPISDLQAPFRPAVAIQQIFSLIKQSPIAAVRLAELAELFAGMLAPADLEAILAYLQARDYLTTGRLGEWRAGPRLNRLYDEQTGAQVSLSIYSNIQSDTHTIAIRDQYTGQTVARADALWLDRDLLTLEGRPVNVEWCDGEALWVASYHGQATAPQMIYRSARQLLSPELARLLPAQLGLPAGAAPFIAVPDGWWWFHWLGDLYGRAALDLLRYRITAHETDAIGLALQVPDTPQAAPNWTHEQVAQYLRETYRQYEPLLALGPFQHLLPTAQRRRAVVEQFDIPRFLSAVAALQPVVAPEGLAEDLARLLD